MNSNIFDKIDLGNLADNFKKVQDMANANLKHAPEEKRAQFVNVTTMLNKTVRELKEKGFDSPNIEELNDELTKLTKDLGGDKNPINN